MPPKRTRSQQSSSQPLPDPPKPVRSSGRKRRHSDASNISDMDAADRPPSSGSAAAPLKRRRKGKATVQEPEVIVEEEEQGDAHAAFEDQHAMLQSDAAQDRDTESIDVSQPRSKHVHFEPSDQADKTPNAKTNTPYPKASYPKMSIKRRVTVSPTTGTNKRIKSTTATPRSSLPAAFSQDDQEPAAIIQQLQFAPLRAVLDERIRRRLRRSHLSEEQNAIEEHEKRDSRTQKELEELRLETAEKEARIKELSLELETQRQFGIDLGDGDDAEHARVKDLEAELSSLKRDVAGNAEVSTLDDDMMVLDSQEMVAYPDQDAPETPTSNWTRTHMRNSSSQELTVESTPLPPVTPSSKHWDAERRRFEEAVLALSEEAIGAKAKLQVLTIELQSIGFGEEDATANAVVESIRDSFDRVRESLETVLPDTVPEDASNQDLLDIVIANVKEFAIRLRSDSQELQNKDGIIAELTKQINGLVDHLAEAEIRKQQLEAQWSELDIAGEKKERDIEALEEELNAAEEERAAVEVELEETKAILDDVQTEKTGLGINLDKLNQSLQGYRDEEARLQDLISKMEEEHEKTVTKMTVEREETVRDLEGRLDAETALHAEAEKQSDERQRDISELEIRVEDVETERDNLVKELEEAQAEFEAETIARETAEADAEEKDIQVNDLEARVTDLEANLEDLNGQLEELRGLNETERHQREAAEADLDTRNVEIDDLNKKLHEMGTQANQLRGKLYEVQQANDIKVQELETAMSERDEQYQTDIAAEVERRETAEQDSQNRNTRILDLQTELEELEDKMKEALLERDERIVALEDNVIQKDTEIQRLEADLNNTQNLYDADVAQSKLRQEELEGSIAALQETISEHEATITEMQQEAARTINLHSSEIEDRNTAVAELNHEVAELRTQVAELETEKAGLERRVESEAEQMLELQNERADEIEALKNTIRDKQAKILVVEEKAVEADRRWQEVLEVRDEEIKALTVTRDTHASAITTSTKKHDELKQKFKDYIRRSSGRIANLQDELNRAKAVVDAEGDALVEDGEQLLEDLEAEDTLGEMETTQTVKVNEKPVRKTRGRKKRVVDSGIGVASDEVDGEGVAA